MGGLGAGKGDEVMFKLHARPGLSAVSLTRRARIEAVTIQNHNVDAAATIDAGILISTAEYPRILVLFDLPKSGEICTGYGSNSLDIYTTKSVLHQAQTVTGHGRVLTVPPSTLDVLMAAYIKWRIEGESDG